MSVSTIHRYRPSELHVRLGLNKGAFDGHLWVVTCRSWMLLFPLSHACEWSDRMQVTVHVECTRLVSIIETHWSRQGNFPNDPLPVSA